MLALEETSLYSLKRTAYEIRDSEALAPIISDLDGELENCPSSIIQQALKLRKNVYHDNELVIYCKNLRHCILFHIEGTRPLSEVDTYLLNLFTENIIIALENIRLNELLADNQREIIYRIGEIVETRSRESGLHVKRVALYCELFGRLRNNFV